MLRFLGLAALIALVAAGNLRDSGVLQARVGGDGVGTSCTTTSDCKCAGKANPFLTCEAGVCSTGGIDLVCGNMQGATIVKNN